MCSTSIFVFPSRTARPLSATSRALGFLVPKSRMHFAVSHIYIYVYMWIWNCVLSYMLTDPNCFPTWYFVRCCCVYFVFIVALSLCLSLTSVLPFASIHVHIFFARAPFSPRLLHNWKRVFFFLLENNIHAGLFGFWINIVESKVYIIYVLFMITSVCDCLSVCVCNVVIKLLWFAYRLSGFYSYRHFIHRRDLYWSALAFG